MVHHNDFNFGNPPFTISSGNSDGAWFWVSSNTHHPQVIYHFVPRTLQQMVNYVYRKQI
jgi:hypothetical protein